LLQEQRGHTNGSPIEIIIVINGVGEGNVIFKRNYLDG
jgi:hypothetical protein